MGNRSATPRPTVESSVQAPRLRLAHQRLETFVGTWKAEGEAYGPTAKLTGTESYEWLTGGFFLIYHFDRRYDDSEHTGIGIIGYDPSTQAYLAHFFDNLGFERTYRMSVHGRVWSLAGEWERATITFGDDGDSFTETWEQSIDGRSWRPLCAFKGTRAG
jgi:hypothetical protein